MITDFTKEGLKRLRQGYLTIHIGFATYTNKEDVTIIRQQSLIDIMKLLGVPTSLSSESAGLDAITFTWGERHAETKTCS